MSKKDYIAVANIITQCAEIQIPSEEKRYVNFEDLVRRLADFFKQDNSNFDKQRFYSACGYEP